MERLTHLQQDALAQLIRLQVGRSSSTLAALSKAPTVVRFERFGSALATGGGAWRVGQRISGDLEGTGGWWVGLDEGHQLIRRVRGTVVGDRDLSPLERDGLLEFGHILIDGLLDAVASALGLRLEASVPTLHRVDTAEHREHDELSGRSGVCIHLSHTVDGHGSASRVSLTWNPPSAGVFQRALALYVSPFLSELSHS